MELWTAFLLGLVGSAHCAGMCGPLALALPATGNNRATFLAGRLLYNVGRIVTYMLLGAVFGLLGKGFALAGLQRWVSLVGGLLILLGLIASSRFAPRLPLLRVVGWLRTWLGRLLKERSLAANFGFGFLNGLLPCGLVYVAALGAAACGEWLLGVAFMAAFGLGTVPMMLALGLAGPRLQWLLRGKVERLVPATMAVAAVLLLLRGMGLGIPYLSPDLASGHAECCPGGHRQ
ncbi:MAG: hypothetical protein RL514_3068 [Verrucomicrobiota bacterium]|jgi:sulfite exporter TauE/SafE